MTENESPTIVFTISKDKVKFNGEFVIVDTGLTIEEFIRAALGFAVEPDRPLAVEQFEIKNDEED